MRYLLVDGQGNFGSVDGDSPAAMRYTKPECVRFQRNHGRYRKKKTVDFQLNFDDTLYEPKVMPTRVPTLLINGAQVLQ
jgi:DNA gyrase subunit A